jgi:hypothetical protein
MDTRAEFVTDEESQKTYRDAVSRLSPEQVKNVLVDRDASDFVNNILPRQFCQWARVTYTAARDLQSTPNPYASGAFWTRLYGLLAEARDWMKEDRSRLAEQREEELARIASDVLAALDSVHGLLDESEQLYLHYRRCAECHPFQDRSFQITDKKNGDQVFNPLLGRRVPVEEVNIAVRNVDTRTDDVTGVVEAARIAEKLVGALDAVQTICADYEAVRAPGLSVSSLAP